MLDNKMEGFHSLVCFVAVVVVLWVGHHFSHLHYLDDDYRETPILRNYDWEKNENAELLFQNWMINFNKTYQKEEKEYEKRYALWLENHGT
jgi:hypothetical protein